VAGSPISRDAARRARTRERLPTGENVVRNFPTRTRAGSRKAALKANKSLQSTDSLYSVHRVRKEQV
jgi:hypothetical protein